MAFRIRSGGETLGRQEQDGVLGDLSRGSCLSSTGTKLWGLADGMEDGVKGTPWSEMDQSKELGCSS